MSDSSDRNPVTDNPVVQGMAEAYAARHGVSVAEGIEAMRVQSAATEVMDEIERVLGGSCGELWFERNPESGERLKVGVAGCGDPPAGPLVDRVKRILEGRGVLPHSDFVALTVSGRELAAAIGRVEAVLAPLGWQARVSAAPPDEGVQRVVLIMTVNDLNAEQRAIVEATLKVAGVPVEVDPCLGPGENTPLPPTPRTPVDWVVLSVGPDSRSLLILYYWGGRYRNQPNLSLTETSDEIQIEVTLPDLTKDPRTQIILGFAAAGRLTVELEAPVNGRRIRGPGDFLAQNPSGNAACRTCNQDGTSHRVVPNVTGLDLEDAMRVLRRQGFQPRITGTGRMVVAQDPAAEVVPPDPDGPSHGPVTLTAGR